MSAQEPAKKTPGMATTTIDLVDETALESLRGWGEDIQARIGHADTKASILLGLSGTALALLPAQLMPEHVSGVVGLSRTSRAGFICGLVGLVLLGACVVLLILAVRPNVTGIGTPVCGSFVGAGSLSAEQILFLAIQAHHGEAPAQAALRVALLARIATRKHARVRLATTFLLASIGPLALSALAVAW